MEGIKPDYSIVVINPYTDPIAYIQDTISALSAVYKCRTLALAYSNVTHRADAGGRFARYILDDEDEIEIKRKYINAFHLPCGCIMDEGYIEEMVDDLLLLLS